MQWINVEVSLPTHDDYVLVYHSRDDYITTGYFDKENVSFYIETNGERFYTDDGWETDIPWAPKDKVTHWMELPKKPDGIDTCHE